MLFIFSSFYLPYYSSLFIFVIASSCFGCFLFSFVISFFSLVVYNLSLALSFHALLLAFPISSLFFLLPSFVPFGPSVFLYRFDFPRSQPNPFLFFFPLRFHFVLFFSCLLSLCLFSIYFFLPLSRTLLSTVFTKSLSYFVVF